jgi:hypothetical protein
MEKMEYEAPKARDLSGLGASGQGPLYLCENGLIAEPEGCLSGGQPAGACSTGLMVGAPSCTAGGEPSSGECITGGAANVGQCLSGNIFQM